MGLPRPVLEESLPTIEEKSGLTPCKFGDGVALSFLLEEVLKLPWSLNRTYASSQIRRFISAGYLSKDSKTGFKITGPITKKDLVSIEEMDYK